MNEIKQGFSITELKNVSLPMVLGFGYYSFTFSLNSNKIRKFVGLVLTNRIVFH